MSNAIFVVGGLVAVALCVWGFVRLWEGEYLLHDLFFVEHDDTSTLWAEERLFNDVGSLEIPQLAILDVDTGVRRVVWTGKDGEIVVLLARHGPFLFWWSSVRGLHTRDRDTGALLLDERAILAKAPALAGKLFPHRDYKACNNYANDANGIRIRTNDARVWTLGFNFALRPAETPWVEVRQEAEKYAVSALTQYGKIRNGTRDVSMDGKDSRTLRVGKRVVGQESYLEGEIATDTDRGGLLVLEDPPSLLVAHRDKLGSGAKRLLSRVTLEGANVWTRSETDYGLKPGDATITIVAFATARKDGIYITLGDRKYSLLVLDPNTGDVLKRVPKARTARAVR